jgi:two-component system, NtrC family, response regulator AtoC
MPPLILNLPLASPESHLIPQRRILLVDGESHDRERYGQALRGKGFVIDLCSSYQEAARCLERENYDFVIVDQGSPAFEGRGVLERSVTRDRGVPVLVITRYHDMACYVEAMQLGAVDYLEKPIALDDLIWAIETHLPSGSRLDAGMAS